MEVKKLPQTQIFESMEAVKSFLNECDIVVDNGNTIIFKAQGIYRSKNKNKSTIIPSSDLSYGINSYGGMIISIPALDERNHFTQLSTDFNTFKNDNGRLVIKGRDTHGTGKGDYEIELFP